MSVTRKEKLIDALNAERDPDDDTLYCNDEHYNMLLEQLSTKTSHMLGREHRPRAPYHLKSIRISGLDVYCFSTIDVPITCKKGEVFPLAGDWQDDEHRRDRL